MSEAFQTEVVALDDLKPHERNYREHPVDQIEHLIQSIEEHGFYRNIVVAKDGTILAGHGVVEAATVMGLTEVPVIRLDVEPDDPKALKVLTGDNELSRMTEFDDRALTELLKEIRDEDLVGLLGTGYDDEKLANLVFVSRPASEIEDYDAAAQWTGMPSFEPQGNRIQLVLAFDSEEERETLIDQLDLFIAKKTRQTWSAWWPPREQEDLSSLRFDSGEAS